MFQKIWIFIALISLIILVISCQQELHLVIPGDKPSETQESLVLQKVIRYLGSLPDKVGWQDRFSKEYDGHYDQEITRYRIDRYFESDQTGDIYFLASRIAPSIYEKRVSYGVHMRMTGDSISYYHEVFRTWKHTEEVLNPRADSLFAMMVNGDDLRPYYADQKGDQYIEFPDSNTYYDTISRRWVSTLSDPVKQLKEEYSRHWEEK